MIRLWPFVIGLLLALVWLPREASAAQCGSTVAGFETWKRQFAGDLMEPLRTIADRKVLEFVQAHPFHSADFTIRSDGVCRLNPEMARRVVRFTESALQMPTGKRLKPSTAIAQLRS
jgi:CRISPR associated protein Cas1